MPEFVLDASMALSWCFADEATDYSNEEREHWLDYARSLPVEVITPTLDHILNEIARLAVDQQLTVYDAAYLDLALREGLPLASLDDRLRAAAGNVGVRLV